MSTYSVLVSATSAHHLLDTACMLEQETYCSRKIFVVSGVMVRACAHAVALDMPALEIFPQTGVMDAFSGL